MSGPVLGEFLDAARDRLTEARHTTPPDGHDLAETAAADTTNSVRTTHRKEQS